MESIINYARLSERLSELTEKTSDLIKITGNQGLLEGLMEELKASYERKELSV